MQSLTKKLGPLPVWAWALIGGVALYIIRKRMGGTTGTGSTSGTDYQGEAQLISAEGTAMAQQLQTSLPLSQGESVYNPNTNSLYSTNPSPANSQAETGLIDLIGLLLLPHPAGKNSSRNNGRKIKHPRNRGHHPRSNKPHGKPPQWATQQAKGRGKDALHETAGRKGKETLGKS